MGRPRRDVVASFLSGSCDLLRRRLVHQVTGRSRRQRAADLLVPGDSPLLTALNGRVSAGPLRTREWVMQVFAEGGLDHVPGWYILVRRWPFRKTSSWTGWDPFSR